MQLMTVLPNLLKRQLKHSKSKGRRNQLMEKAMVEQAGGTDILQGNYYLPNLVLPAEGEQNPSVYGDRGIYGI